MERKKKSNTLNESTFSIIASMALFVGSISLLLAFLGFLPNNWWCDLASQFRLLYSLTLLCTLLILLLSKHRLGALLLGLGLIVDTIPIVSMFVPRVCVHYESRKISLLNFNTERGNKRPDLLLGLIKQQDPDLVALTEVGGNYLEKLEPLLPRYPFTQFAPDGPGLALYSKFPIEAAEVQHFGITHHPILHASILAGKAPLTVVVAHPPTPSSDARYLERNEEFAEITRNLKTCPSPKILLGDLNCGPWSPAFGHLVVDTGLHDSAQGFGLQPTWPARPGRVFPGIAIPPLVPIDHVLVSKDICVKQRVVGPPLNSDHLPVFVTLSIPQRI